MKLVNPTNKRKFTVIVVGTGLAGAAAAATLAQLGYNVKGFTFHDSPRRAHSIAAQGGINAAKNYKNDGDSVYRLFYDTVKGGDFRARESNVYRLAQVSRRHHRPVRGPGRALRPRVRRPARQPLVRWRPGEPHVLRPRPDRPAAPARRLPGADAAGGARHRRDAHQDRDARRRDQGRRLRGIVTRDLTSGDVEELVGARRAAVHRRLRQRLLPVHQRHELQHHGHLAGPQEGRTVRQPLLHADPPDLHPGERRVPVEAHAHVGVAAQRRAHLGAQELRRDPPRRPDPRGRPRLLPRAPLPVLRQPRPPRRRLPQRQDRGRRGSRASARSRTACTSTSPTPSTGSARTSSTSATGTSSTCTSASPTRTRTRCRCASTPPPTTRWVGCGSTTTS